MAERREAESLPAPEEFFRTVRETPLADVLVDTFVAHTKQPTWEIRKTNYGNKIEGWCTNTPDDYDRRMIKLEKFYSDARLMVYGYKSEVFDTDDYWGDLSFVAGVKEAGTWTANRGNLQTFGKSVSIRDSSLRLPNPLTVWILNIAAQVSNEASRRYNQNQPQFWDLKSKYRKPNQLDLPE